LIITSISFVLDINYHTKRKGDSVLHASNMAFVQSLSKNVSVFVLGLVLLNCFSVDKFGSHAQVAPLLPEDEGN
jgi:hypothetical protein